MTAEELEAILLSAEFQQDLQEMSSYLASIKQERPIIHCLAKFLWRRGRVFQLEDEHRDLVVDQTHLEFKYHFDCDMASLEGELKKCGDKPLKVMWDDVQGGRKSKSWGVMAQIYEDMCIKMVRNRLTDIFVWVICARDLRNVPPDAIGGICWSLQQLKWNETHRYSDPANLRVADSFLAKVRAERSYSIRQAKIVTNSDFPSTYHLRICNFSETEE